jgi:D-sedoheptulose 7-phosphate isomerase
MHDLFLRSLNSHRKVFDDIVSTEIETIARGGELIFEALAKGNKVLLCGNGGSAADAQHIAAEFVGRYENERRAYPSIALTTDTSALTAIGNDYGYERVFARQMEALAREGDVLIAISTSGNSPNVLAAIETARAAGCAVIGMAGRTGGMMREICDVLIAVPADRTARIQEAHITIGHLWCEYVDAMTEQAGGGPGSAGK